MSMSWTIRRNDSDKKQQDDWAELEKAIGAAVNKGILLFCAAPDDGTISDGTFDAHLPVGSKERSRIFRVGAASANNTKGEYTASQAQFLFPGQDIEQPDLSEKAMGSPVPVHPASSIATALAAGLAALIMDCVRLAAIARHRSQWMFAQSLAGGQRGIAHGTAAAPPISISTTEKEFAKIKKITSIQQVFNGITRDNSGRPIPGGYVDVKRVFGDAAKGLTDRANIEAMVERLADLADQLVREVHTDDG